jgi:hypothetical protein
MAIFAATFATFTTGCAQIVVGTDPSAGVVYAPLSIFSNYPHKAVEADVHGDVQKVSQLAQMVLEKHGFQTSTAQTSNTSGEQNMDGRNGLHGATVHILSTGPASSHVEVAATEGKLCWNMDYAGQILQDIALSAANPTTPQ